MEKTIVVMTGGTSGLGAVAAANMVTSPGLRLLLGYRKKRVAGAEHFFLDLKSLRSVRKFAFAVQQAIGGEKINTVVCNAGMNYPSVDTRTEDGFETTFAVNHLAHFLLVRLLMPYMATGARIILTTSGTHNPAEKTVAAPPRHANAIWLAHPEEDTTLDKKMMINAQRAYASSKLCNILTVRYLSALPQARSGEWTCLAYDPGPTPGTGLMQNGNLVMRGLWQLLVVSALRKRMLPKSNSIAQAGTALADLALGRLIAPGGREYAALRRGTLTFPDPSSLALNDGVMKKMWTDTESLLQLDPI